MFLFKRSAATTSAGSQSLLHSAHQWLSDQLENGSRQGTIKSVEGVRGIACLAVLWFHLNLIMRSTHVWNPLQSNVLFSAIALAGASGVTLFFVLSGFLLFMPFVKAALFETQWPSTWRFYSRRVLRIVPGYYFSLFLLILLTSPAYFRPDHLADLGLFLTFFMDAPATFMQINGPYWTLAIEWQFYLLLPWLALGIGLIARRIGGSPSRRAWLLASLLFGVIAWGVYSRYWGPYLLEHPAQTFLIPRPILNVPFFFLYGDAGKYLEDFAVGMLVSLCYVLATRQRASDIGNHSQGDRSLSQGDRKGRPYPTTNEPEGKMTFAVVLKSLSPWLFGGGLLLLLFMALWHYNMWYQHSVPALDAIAPMYNIVSEFLLASGFGLCLAAILFGAARLRGLFEWRFLRFMGMISYSLYIWHLPLLVLFMTDVGYKIETWNPFAVYSLYLLWIALAIIPFTFLCYKFVEKPWMDLSARWTIKGNKQHA